MKWENSVSFEDKFVELREEEKMYQHDLEINNTHMEDLMSHKLSNVTIYADMPICNEFLAIIQLLEKWLSPIEWTNKFSSEFITLFTRGWTKIFVIIHGCQRQISARIFKLKKKKTTLKITKEK